MPRAGDCSCNNPQLAAYLIHVRKLEKDFDALELQHVPRELNSAASTWASVPKGVFERRLLRPTAQPAELGEGDQASTSKLAIPAASHLWCQTCSACSVEDPGDLVEPLPPAQEAPDAWISEIRGYLKDNILPNDDVSAERIVRLAKRYAVVEGDLYRRGANGVLMWCISRERAVSCSRRSMEASVEVIPHLARLLARPFVMASTGQQHSRMRLSW